MFFQLHHILQMICKIPSLSFWLQLFLSLSLCISIYSLLLWSLQTSAAFVVVCSTRRLLEAWFWLASIQINVSNFADTWYVKRRITTIHTHTHIYIMTKDKRATKKDNWEYMKISYISNRLLIFIQIFTESNYVYFRNLLTLDFKIKDDIILFFFFF